MNCMKVRCLNEAIWFYSHPNGNINARCEAHRMRHPIPPWLKWVEHKNKIDLMRHTL